MTSKCYHLLKIVSSIKDIYRKYKITIHNMYLKRCCCMKHRHSKRMDEHRIPKILLEMRMSGRKPRGRQCDGLIIVQSL
jgi:hypothetical protein